MELRKRIETIFESIEMFGGGVKLKHKYIFFRKNRLLPDLTEMAVNQNSSKIFVSKLVHQLYGTWGRHRNHP